MTVNRAFLLHVSTLIYVFYTKFLAFIYIVMKPKIDQSYAVYTFVKKIYRFDFNSKNTYYVTAFRTEA